MSDLQQNNLLSAEDAKARANAIFGMAGRGCALWAITLLVSSFLPMSHSATQWLSGVLIALLLGVAIGGVFGVVPVFALRAMFYAVCVGFGMTLLSFVSLWSVTSMVTVVALPVAAAIFSGCKPGWSRPRHGLSVTVLSLCVTAIVVAVVYTEGGRALMPASGVLSGFYAAILLADLRDLYRDGPVRSGGLDGGEFVLSAMSLSLNFFCLVGAVVLWDGSLLASSSTGGAFARGL